MSSPNEAPCWPTVKTLGTMRQTYSKPEDANKHRASNVVTTWGPKTQTSTKPQRGALMLAQGKTLGTMTQTNIKPQRGALTI